MLSKEISQSEKSVFSAKQLCETGFWFCIPFAAVLSSDDDDDDDGVEDTIEQEGVPDEEEEEEGQGEGEDATPADDAAAQDSDSDEGVVDGDDGKSKG